MKDDTFSIYYPSGNLLQVFARYIGHKRDDDTWHLCLEMLENKLFNGQMFNVGAIMVIDPRCVIIDSINAIRYTPRPNIERIDQNFRDWLDTNLDWPDRLELPNLIES